MALPIGKILPSNVLKGADVSRLKDMTPDSVVLSSAPPMIAGVNTPGDCDGFNGGLGLNINEELKVPAGLELGKSNFIIKDNTIGGIPAHSKIANEKNPIDPNGGDKYTLESLLGKQGATGVTALIADIKKGTE